MIKSIVETGFNYWNFYVDLEALELWHELTGEEFVIDGGYIVAIGKDGAND